MNNKKVYGYVYCRIFPNNKAYIGLTSRSCNERWKNQNRDAMNGENGSYKLYNALRKYDYQTEDIILHSFKTKTELDLAERIIIKMYNSQKNGYNIDGGGFNGNHSEETKKKIGASQKGRKRSKKTKERMKNSQIGKKLSNQTKKSISDKFQKCGIFKTSGTSFKNNKNPEKKCWQSSIRYKNKSKSLGYFEDPFTAELVYNLVRNELYKEVGL